MWDILRYFETLWNIVRHFGTLWNIMCQQICETSAGPSSPEGEYLKHLFNFAFGPRMSFAICKTLMNRIYIAEWNLKIFHQKDCFCRKICIQIIFGQNFCKLLWAKLSGGAIFKNNVDKRSLSKSFKPQQFWRTGRVYREAPQ